MYLLPGEGETSQVSKKLCGDPAVFEECRTYAKELAQSAGLRILNTMPAQRPPTTEDGRPIITSWLNNTCAATIRNSLGLVERRWFDKRWVGDAVDYYRCRGFAAQVEIAAVVVLLGRGTELTHDPLLPVLDR